MTERRLTPEELATELDKRAYGEGGLVGMTVTQWKVITEAYHSPLMERIADSVIQFSPQRDVKTKELSFWVSAKELKAF